MTFPLLRSLPLRYSTFNPRAFSVAAPVRTALPTDATLRTGAEDPSTWDDPDSIPDFGQYNVVLPEEPFVYSTAHIPRRLVDARVPRSPYAADGSSAAAYAGEDTPVRLSMNRHHVQDLRRAARLAKETLEYAGALVQVSHPRVAVRRVADADEPGVTTDALDAAVHQFIVERGAYPSPLGYKGFPKSCCTSVNNVIAHGIPDE
jgi:methionyl aminopeptidase